MIIIITSAAGAGAAVGNLVAVSSLSEVQHESYTEATVLLVKHIGGEEDIPEVRCATSHLLLNLTSAPNRNAAQTYGTPAFCAYKNRDSFDVFSQCSFGELKHITATWLGLSEPSPRPVLYF